MQFKFSFKTVNSDRIPLVDVQITNKENHKTLGYRALLDSGAFVSVFHSDIADFLGINLSKIKEKVVFGGVENSTRKMKGKFCIVELMVMEKGRSFKFDSYVVFSDEISDTGFALLGRQGFFDKFDEVCFDYKDNKFYLRKN